MNDHTEDLYLKGFMAFSAKNFAEAKAHWEGVLALDPSHEKARQGLAELKSKTGRKRTSKEILQEIKAFYAAKKYPEALKLCEVLIKKYPSNQDLVGLYRKIANRIQQSSDAPSSSNDFENTIYFTKKAEEFVANVSDAENHAPAPPVPQAPPPPSQEQIAKLIQRGVAEYEAGTLPKALATWQEALKMDPDNRIARDYIANVKAVIAKRGAAPPAPKAKPARPSKEKLLEAYNQGLRFYQNKEFTQALDRWNFILKFHPNHKETLQCLEKTKAALEKKNQQLERLEQGRKELAEGNHVAAQSIVMQLAIEAPDLEGLAQLKESVEERQRQINEIRSMEIEAEGTHESSFSPTDDEITQYFTPETEGGTSGARQVSRVIVPKKEKKPLNKWLVFGMPLVLIGLGVGGYFGWEYYQRQLLAAETDTFIMPAVEINWNSDWQRAEDFLVMGNDFVNEGDYLLASLAFQRVEKLVSDRIAKLEEIHPDGLPYDEQSELKRLLDIQSQTAERLPEVTAKIASPKGDVPNMESVEADIRKERWVEAEKSLRTALLADSSDQTVRSKYGELEERLAFNKLKQDEIHEALTFFRRAAVLKPGYETARQHVEVIQRYFNGSITALDKNQWFFFFQE